MNVEGLLIGFIVMALAALLGRKKTDEDSARPEKPLQPTRQRSLKRAEDYAKEIYGELQAQIEQQPDNTKQMVRKVQETIDNAPYREPKPTGAASRHSARKPRAVDQAKAGPNKNNLFPLETEDIQKSIILAEILMPPKSKR
jgi:gas vesicle protein